MARVKQQGDGEWMALVEGARLLRVGYQVAHRLALQGTLEARRTNGRWTVSRRSVDRLRAERAAAPVPAPVA